LKGIRKARQRETEFYRGRDHLQACRVCGRYFTAQRKEPICSVTCKAKADAGHDGRQTD
jgi:hypothetical protein